MSGKLHIITLGEFFMEYDKRPISGFVPREVEALILYVARARSKQSVGTVASLLWEGLTRVQAKAELISLIDSLDDDLRAILDTVGEEIALPDIDFDANEFEENVIAATQLVARHNGRINREAANTYAKAVKLYNGDFAENFQKIGSEKFNTWLLQERMRLRSQVLETLDTLADYYLEVEGVFTEGRNPYYLGLEHANRALHLDPMREKSHGQVMQFYVKLRQEQKAFNHYDTYIGQMKKIGEEPSRKVMAIYAGIKAGQAPGPVAKAESAGSKLDTGEYLTRQLSTQGKSGERGLALPGKNQPDRGLMPLDGDEIGSETQPMNLDARGLAVYEPPKESERPAKQKSTPPSMPATPKVSHCHYCGKEIQGDLPICADCAEKVQNRDAAAVYARLHESRVKDNAYFGEDSLLILHFTDTSIPLRVSVPSRAGLTVGRTDESEHRSLGIDLTQYNGLQNGVSRVHAMVQRQGETLVVSDLGSSNGTRLNNQLLAAHAPRVIRSGDEIQFGNLTARVRFEHPDAE